MLKIQKVSNYVYQNLFHKAHVDVYNNIKYNPYLLKEENEKRQLEKLNQLLNHAYQNVLYYREVFEKYAVNGKIDLKSVEELKNFPFLTKKIIQDQKENLYSTDIMHRKISKNSTGGSTGEPIVFLQDEDYKASNFANFYITQSWRDVDPYDSVFKLWGAGRDTFEGKKSLKIHLSDFYRNRMQFNCYKMTEDDILFFIQKLNQHKPKIVLAYVHAIYDVAIYAKEKNIKIQQQNAIHTAAGTLYDFMREEIENVFQCKVFNHYGSREAGSIASECSEHNGLHIMMEHTLVEIVKEDGSLCEEGEEGEVVITTLANYAMPLIRYKIGDIASLKKYEECSCGCTYPKIENVSGRTLERIRTMANDIISPEYFVCQIGGDKDYTDIEKFQIVQKALNEIVVKIVKKTELSQKRKDDIIDKIQAVMGTECDVEFEFVEEIPKTATGKYLYVVSELEK